MMGISPRIPIISRASSTTRHVRHRLIGDDEIERFRICPEEVEGLRGRSFLEPPE